MVIPSRQCGGCFEGGGEGIAASLRCWGFSQRHVEGKQSPFFIAFCIVSAYAVFGDTRVKEQIAAILLVKYENARSRSPPGPGPSLAFLGNNLVILDGVAMSRSRPRVPRGSSINWPVGAVP